MERMTESEILEVVQAYMDGKEFEYLDLRFEDAGWASLGKPSWNFVDYRYRVKRQPRVIWVPERPTTGLDGAYCYEKKPNCGSLRLVKFIEVMDD